MKKVDKSQYLSGFPPFSVRREIPVKNVENPAQIVTKLLQSRWILLIKIFSFECNGGKEKRLERDR